jgi:hypothetical protein
MPYGLCSRSTSVQRLSRHRSATITPSVSIIRTCGILPQMPVFLQLENASLDQQIGKTFIKPACIIQFVLLYSTIYRYITHISNIFILSSQIEKPIANLEISVDTLTMVQQVNLTLEKQKESTKPDLLALFPFLQGSLWLCMAHQGLSLSIWLFSLRLQDSVLILGIKLLATFILLPCIIGILVLVFCFRPFFNSFILNYEKALFIKQTSQALPIPLTFTLTLTRINRTLPLKTSCHGVILISSTVTNDTKHAI